MAAKQVTRSRARYTQKRKKWSQTSMLEAIKAVKKGMTLREVSSLYGVPVSWELLLWIVVLDLRP